MLWLIVGIVLGCAFYLWYLWALARLFPRIGLPGDEGWIPVWNQWKLLERAGLPGWSILLTFVGLGIVPGVMLVLTAHRLGREYGADSGYTVLSIVLPPAWAVLLANHRDRQSGGSAGTGGNHERANYAVAAGRHGGYAAAVSPERLPVPMMPQQPAPGATLPRLPDNFVNAAARAPVAEPTADPAAEPVSPWSAAGFAAHVDAPIPLTTQQGALLGSETESEYERLAAQAFQAPPAVGLGRRRAPSNVSHLAAVPEPNPFGASQSPQSSAPDSPASSPRTAPPLQPVTPFGPVMEAALAADHTVVASRRKLPVGVLELPGDGEVPIYADSIIGRRPKRQGQAVAVTVPDHSRTLSKSHVRLLREGGRWLVEDLGSTNGTVLLYDDGTERELQAGVRVEATERMLFGVLEVRLRSAERRD